MRPWDAACARRLTLLAAGVALTTTGCGANAPDKPGAQTLGPRYGISVELPEGWVGRLSRGALVAATFPVPPAGSVGLREMAFPQIEEDDVRVLLFENAPENRSPPTELGDYPVLVGKLEFAASDFSSMDGNSDDSVQSGHGFGRRPFRFSDRLFVVFVEAGTLPPARAQLAELKALLGSLAVEPGDFYPGRVAPPRFAPRPGWHVGDSGAEEADADGEFTAAYAATIPYADAWNALPFGRPDPTAAMRKEAQAMLDGLDLPDWGPWELER
jgi:hypothetical protein